WQTVDPLTGTTAASPELQRQLRALDKEQRQLIRELLGVDLRTEMARYTDEEESAATLDAFLSPEAQEQVHHIAEKYDDLEQEVYGRSRGLFLPEDQEELKQIQRARRAELA